MMEFYFALCSFKNRASNMDTVIHGGLHCLAGRSGILIIHAVLDYPEVYLFGANDARNWIAQPFMSGEPHVHTVISEQGDIDSEDVSDAIYRIEETLAAFTHHSYNTSNRIYLYDKFQGITSYFTRQHDLLIIIEGFIALGVFCIYDFTLYS
jgi:hypothetical protein